MSYLVLARKWRPQRFEDLVGQDHVARTLGNAITSGRIAHAFLFTGVRGVGKTTSARILAKALNCMGPAEARRTGPSVSPCLVCEACSEIAQGSDMDVREIDGASYNGVDEVRKLQDALPYRPARDRYKIFIVDEVHMLSQSAWNAFLKTLEEPPPHVKFIFATTEVHKVPITILSRVQRFDFKLISTQMITARLREVLAAERIQADDASVSIVAREAAGSMRDAMSVLDQVIAWGGDRLTGGDVARVLGVASHRVLHELSQALVEGDAARCLSIVSELANQGFDIAHVARDLLSLLRDLVVAKVVSAPEALLDLPDAEVRDVKELAQASQSDDLMRLYHGFSQGFDEVVQSERPRIAIEMLLVRLARRPPLLPIDELLTRLAGLERRLGQGQGSARDRPAPPRPPAPHAEARPASAPISRPSAPSAEARPAGAPSSRPREPSSGAAAKASVETRDDAGEPPPFWENPPPDRFDEDDASSASRTSLARRASVTPAPATSAVLRAPAPILRPAQVAANAAPARPTVADIEQLDQRYRALLELLEAERPDLAALLAHAIPLEVSANGVIIAWEPGSVLSAVDNESVTAIARVAEKQFSGPVPVRFEFESERARGRRSLAAVDGLERKEKTRAAYVAAQKHERIAEAVEILGAKLKELKLGGAA